MSILLIVLSVFTIIVSTLFVNYPESVLPVWLQIPIAVWLGWQIRQGKSDFLYSIIAVLLMYLSILLVVKFPVKLMPLWGSEKIAWSAIIFIYALIIT